MRPSVSAAPPAANGATILTGFVGQLCACVLAGPAKAALPIPMSTSRRRMAHPSLNSAMRSQPLNLHLRQERDQRMGTHFRDGWQIKLDERFPLLRRQLELIGVGRSIRYVLCAQRRIVSETMECRG